MSALSRTADRALQRVADALVGLLFAVLDRADRTPTEWARITDDSDESA